MNKIRFLNDHGIRIPMGWFLLPNDSGIQEGDKTTAAQDWVLITDQIGRRVKSQIVIREKVEIESRKLTGTIINGSPVSGDYASCCMWLQYGTHEGCPCTVCASGNWSRENIIRHETSEEIVQRGIDFGLVSDDRDYE